MPCLDWAETEKRNNFKNVGANCCLDLATPDAAFICKNFDLAFRKGGEEQCSQMSLKVAQI